MGYILTILTLPLKVIWRLIIDFDHLITLCSRKILPGKFILVGACKKRGLCCKRIAIYVHPKWLNSHKLQNCIKWVYRFLYNFEFKEKDSENSVLLFKCGHLGVNGMCTIHWRRPMICRHYPLIHRYKTPTLLPGCGYKVFTKR